MKATIGIIMATAALAQFNGCPLIGPNSTSVRLVNNGSFPVDVELRISDDQLILEDILSSNGERIDQTLAAGDSVTISRDCEDLQAIMVEDADLQLVGEIGPEADTDVLRDGDDFTCGDTIVYTFSHPAIPTSLDINTNVEN